MAKTIEVPDPHMQQIQEALTAAGYQPGVIDGIPGPKSLAAVLDVIGERNVARSNATALEQARATAEKALVATRNERDQLRDTVDQATTLLDNAGYETGSGVAAGIGRVLDHVLDLQREARDLRAQLEETVPLELESGPSNRQVSLEVAARTLAATDFDPERMAVALGQVKGVAEQYVAWLESE